jgi:hypothetical protein
MINNWIQVTGLIKPGYGVASGKGGDLRFPQGTIAMQKPFFQQLGLDLSPYFLGTINISIHPYQYAVINSRYTFRNVKWSSTEPAEDFSFFDCQIIFAHATPVQGLIYYPHPETKPEHFQTSDTLEIIAPYINDLRYGHQLILKINRKQISIV